MAGRNTWRDPKALALWLVVALVLWLLIPAGATLGVMVWEWTNPGVGYAYDPMVIPPFLVHGSVGLVAALGVVVLVCRRLRLGLLWLVLAVLLAGILWALAPLLPGTSGVYLTVLLPPVIGALVFRPRAPLEY
ncbi:hypothetical protein [Tessaracoccus oleiagri]|uniref:Uncharacterized protein n=1 Tax=Tessaracoccus oleiagri TaxID=686624 RepID=A0A1G9KYF6_9ACTN|nr:hypothetical protein [Tessaracoccus oleiagri]SDL54375.1 hypothetical protein SAMN04488242_1878 [Tessaracoccus oleiagri]